MKREWVGPLYLALAASIWGGMYVVSKIVLTVVPPLTLVWVRYVVALLALALVGLLSGQSWRVRWRDLPWVVTVGVVGYVVSIGAQFYGTKLSTAQLGSVITAGTPAFMALFAYPLLKERLTWRKGISLGLATSGVLLVVGVGTRSLTPAYRLGGWVLVLAAVTWALMSVMVKRVPGNYSQWLVTTLAIFVATLLLTPAALYQWPGLQVSQLIRPEIWGGILYVGVISTAGAFYFWNEGLRRVPAGSAGVYFFLQPVVGTLLGWLVLGEQVGWNFWIGGLLVLGGVALVLRET